MLRLSRPPTHRSLLASTALSDGPEASPVGQAALARRVRRLPTTNHQPRKLPTSDRPWRCIGSFSPTPCPVVPCLVLPCLAVCFSPSAWRGLSVSLIATLPPTDVSCLNSSYSLLIFFRSPASNRLLVARSARSPIFAMADGLSTPPASAPPDMQAETAAALAPTSSPRLNVEYHEGDAPTADKPSLPNRA
jgi:hypothetical protein